MNYFKTLWANSTNNNFTCPIMLSIMFDVIWYCMCQLYWCMASMDCHNINILHIELRNVSLLPVYQNGTSMQHDRIDTHCQVKMGYFSSIQLCFDICVTGNNPPILGKDMYVSAMVIYGKHALSDKYLAYWFEKCVFIDSVPEWHQYAAW